MQRLFLFTILLAVACGDDSSPAMDASFPDSAVPDAARDAGVDAPLFDGGVDSATPPDVGVDAGAPTFGFDFTDPPIDPGVPVRFATANFGDHRNLLMDIWLPESEEPTAVVVFYHGGGFLGGSRQSAHRGSAAMLRSVLGQGIAWVGIDYRFVSDTTIGGVQGSLHDCRRGLQFLRYYSSELNIDPERVGLTGGSAGAGTSLWLALHDDMAIPDAEDPVERMSTRVSVLAVWETQATYDVLRWPTDVYSPTYPMTGRELIEDVGIAFQVVAFYGFPLTLSTDPDRLWMELNTEEMMAYRADIDMLALMSADDPPIYLLSEEIDAAPDAPGFDLLHHPLHSMALRDAAEAAGVPLEATINAFDITTDVGTVEHLVSNL